MLIYKFRITAEDNDAFFREIEIRPSHTFEDLHETILNSISLEEGEMASFYLCDYRWHKLEEIALFDLTETDEEEEKPLPKLRVMAETKLGACIDDPNQHIMYVYDFLKMYTFYIELYEIMEGDDAIKYPRCTKSTGDFQKPVHKILPKEGDDDWEGDLAEDDDPIFDESSDHVSDDDQDMFSTYVDENSPV